MSYWVGASVNAILHSMWSETQTENVPRSYGKENVNMLIKPKTLYPIGDDVHYYFIQPLSLGNIQGIFHLILINTEIIGNLSCFLFDFDFKLKIKMWNNKIDVSIAQACYSLILCQCSCGYCLSSFTHLIISWLFRHFSVICYSRLLNLLSWMHLFILSLFSVLKCIQLNGFTNWGIQFCVME